MITSTMKNSMIDILWEKDGLLAINKPAGMLSQSGAEEEESVLSLLGGAVHPVNRIDRPVSGLLLLARTPDVASVIQEQFQSGRVLKSYLAAVATEPEKKEGALEHYILHDSKRKKALIADKEAPKARKAVLSYKLLQNSDRYFLLQVQPQTGRFHQIRAQLAAIGSPVKGDVKYGARRGNKDRSIHLHAWRLEFEWAGEKVSLEAPLPAGDPIWEWFNSNM